MFHFIMHSPPDFDQNCQFHVIVTRDRSLFDSGQTGPIFLRRSKQVTLDSCEQDQSGFIRLQQVIVEVIDDLSTAEAV